MSERRIFMIDVGNLPPDQAREYLEKVKMDLLNKPIRSKPKDKKDEN